MGSEKELSNYVHFVETVLKPKLRAAEFDAAAARKEISDYQSLTKHLNDRVRDGITREPIDVPEVDLGYQRVFSAARVEDPSDQLFVGIGLGFHVQLTPTEAAAAARRRMAFLKQHKLNTKESEIKEIKKHVASASIILDQLHHRERD